MRVCLRRVFGVLMLRVVALCAAVSRVRSQIKDNGEVSEVEANAFRGAVLNYAVLCVVACIV